MGYKRCCVPDCLNSSYVKDKSFFKITSKYRTTWKNRIAPNFNLDIPDNAYICEDHFEECDFINVDNKSQGFAVPKIHLPKRNVSYPERNEYRPMDENDDAKYEQEIGGNFIEVAGEMEIGSADRDDMIPENIPDVPAMKNVNPEVDHDHDYFINPLRTIMIAEKMVEMEEREIKLKRVSRKKSKVIQKKNVLIKKLRLQLMQLKQKCKKNTEEQLVDPILLELQANKYRKCGGARYSDAMKHLALILHYCSVKAYKQMRQIFALPSVSTLRKWLAKIDVGEGFSANIFNLLKIKASYLPEEEKLVTIFFDEMAITEKISYFGNAKPDYFTGFSTKLPGRSDINTNVRAKSALVVMIKSIRSGFKQSIGYFFCKDLKSEELKLIIDEAIQLVTESGFTPKILVCDQNSVNRALFTKEYNVSVSKPYFDIHMGTRTNRIYCMPDAPHLYKSTRNNLLKHNAVYDGGVCSFQHIVDLYWEDVKHTPRTVPGLSYDHIKLSQFAEMNVGLAAKTLSHSVAVGLRAYVETKKLQDGALCTAAYCEDFDELFDAANSSHFDTAKAMKRPLQANSPHWAMLDAMVIKLKSLKFVNKDCFDIKKEKEFKPLVKQSRTPYFIEGWLLYIAALKLIWKELHDNYGFKFLRTRNLSQDCLEHFFSQVRWKNGNNCHPDASLFSSAYKALVINHLILPEKIGNVQADMSKYLINREELSKIQIVKDSHVRPFYLDDDAGVEITQDDAGDINQSSNIHWTTGWVCSKLRHKECVERVSADADEINQNVTFLAGLKKYTQSSKIFNPGVRIYQYFSKVCKLFEEHFMLLLRIDTVGVKEELMDIILAKFKFSAIENANISNIVANDELEGTAESEEQLILEVLCKSCAVRISNKYLNMLIACKIGQLNNAFNEKAQSKRKVKKREKAKKLNIVSFSKLLTPEATVGDGLPKNTSSSGNPKASSRTKKR